MGTTLVTIRPQAGYVQASKFKQRQKKSIPVKRVTFCPHSARNSGSSSVNGVKLRMDVSAYVRKRNRGAPAVAGPGKSGGFKLKILWPKGRPSSSLGLGTSCSDSYRPATLPSDRPVLSRFGLPAGTAAHKRPSVHVDWREHQCVFSTWGRGLARIMVHWFLSMRRREWRTIT